MGHREKRERDTGREKDIIEKNTERWRETSMIEREREREREREKQTKQRGKR